jgi:hypothetical protein
MNPSEGQISRHNLSVVYKQKTAKELLELQKIFKYVTIAWIPLCLAVIIMSSFWSDIQGKKSQYTKNDATNSNGNDYWQACLVQADYQYIIFSELLAYQMTAKIKNFATCIGSAGTCGSDCINTIFGCASQLQGGSVSDVGKFLFCPCIVF